MHPLPRKAINLADCLQLLAFYNKTFLHCVTVSMFQQHLATGDQFVDMEFSLHNIQCQICCYEFLPCSVYVTLVAEH